MTAVNPAAPPRGGALDIGCGVGATARALALARPGLVVTGADLSPSLINVARARPALPNLRFVEQDALATAAALAPLDLLVSRHGVMFFADPLAGFAALNAAAAPGAPLVFSCFRSRADNDWSSALEAALAIPPTVAQGYQPGPFAFADQCWTGELLAAAGWREATVRAADVPWAVSGGDDPVADALGFFTRIGTVARVLAEAAPAERRRLRERLRALLERRCRNGAVTFTATIWLWTAYAGGEGRP